MSVEVESGNASRGQNYRAKTRDEEWISSPQKQSAKQNEKSNAQSYTVQENAP